MKRKLSFLSRCSSKPAEKPELAIHRPALGWLNHLVLALALSTGLGAASLSAQTYIAILEGSQEVPPNNSGANGYGQIILDAAQSNITVSLGWNALSSAAVDAHIHGPAGRGTNADVLFTLDMIPTTTNVANVLQSFPVTPDQVAQLQAGLWYLDVHSDLFFDGELRGQIVACTSNVVVHNTNDAGPGSLRQAIAEVCAGGTIQFDAALTGQTITLTTGTLQIDRDVQVQGLGADKLTIARSSSVRPFRVCNVLNGAVVTLSGLTITNGQAAAGGGIGCFDSDLTLQDCVVAFNFGAQGGGILNVTGSIILENSTVAANQGSIGGGIFNFGSTLTLHHSIVSGNVAAGPSCIGGGIANLAIDQDATVELNGSLVVSNLTIDMPSDFASGGGGISSAADSNRTALVFVVDSQLIGNEARGSGASFVSGIGGAIFNSFLDFNSTNVVVLDHSTIAGNRAANGGGLATVSVGPVLEAVFADSSSIVYNTAGSTNAVDGLGGGVLAAGAFVIATNVTLSGNVTMGDPEQGGGFGGALATLGIAQTVTVLVNSTVAQNSAPSGGAFANLAVSFAPEIDFLNTLIASNTATVSLSPNCFNDGGVLLSLGHNLEDSDGCGFTNATDIVTNNVLLGPLQDNGGPTLTHALLPGSPAIDAGDNTDAPLLDQRGVPRPQGAAVDIGAFELAQASPPLFTVCQTNLTVPVDPGLCTALVSFTVTAEGTPAPEVVCRTDLATLTSPALFTIGTHMVTCTASNVAGNATCAFTVTVHGTVAPSITCPSNIVQSVDPGHMTATVTWPPPVFDTGCGPGLSGCQPPSGSQFAIGTNTVVCFASNAAGDRATCAFTVTVGGSPNSPSPRSLKQSVLTNLIALRVDKRMKPDKDKLDDAIKHLSKSLDPNLWLDASHLQPKDGEKVFQEEKETAHKLEELIKDKKSSIPDATLEALVGDLIKADRQLAQLAIQEAKAVGFDSKAIEHALNEFNKATREASEGKSESAIEHYRNAWKEVVPKGPKGAKGPKGPMAPMGPMEPK